MSGMKKDKPKVDLTQKRLERAAQEWRTTFDAISDWVSIHDKDFKVVRANKAFARAFNLQPKEIIGKVCYELIHGTKEPIPDCPHREALATGKPCRNEFFDPHLGLYTETACSPIINGQGQITSTVHIVRNITEQKQAEEALRENERRFAAVLDVANKTGEAIVLLQDTSEIEGAMVFYNETWPRMTGYAPDELERMSFFDLLHPDDRNDSLSRYRRRLAGETLSSIVEFSIIRKDGTAVPLSIATGITRYHGKPTVVDHITDITERKQAEEEIRKFKVIADNAPYGVSISDLEGKIIYVNESHARMHGYTVAELIGQDFSLLYTEEQLKAAQAFRNQVAQTGKSVTAELWRKKKDGTIFPALLNTTCVKDDTGKPLYLCSTVFDLTEQKRIQAQLMATDRLASIGELVAGVAHELNNPLTGVIGFSDLLMERKDLPQDIREDLTVINREAMRTANIVRNLLTFSRKHPQAREPVDINDLIQAVLTLHAYEQKVHNIQTITRFAPALPEIMADGFQLQQVFLNIIINAEYFMIQAHGKGTLTITTEQVGDVIRVSFTDDGPGIPKENLRHIFNAFFTTKEVGKGTGLGLSICQRIVTEHGGKIYAESEPGKGATFIVELPTKQEPPHE